YAYIVFLMPVMDHSLKFDAHSRDEAATGYHSSYYFISQAEKSFSQPKYLSPLCACQSRREASYEDSEEMTIQKRGRGLTRSPLLALTLDLQPLEC
ncbi:hypothetical protein STEG23_031557, partial [Scotinomys teguina]